MGSINQMEKYDEYIEQYSNIPRCAHWKKKHQTNSAISHSLYDH